ncbi:MAG: Lipopolysaccharide core heptosyltransferase RfaQ [Pseudomonadota bacterium]
MASLLFHTAEDLLGDALIKLPSILALKRAHPDLHLVWSAGQGSSAYANVLKPLVDGVIDEVYQQTGLGTRWTQALRPFWPRHFDCIIASERRLLPTLALRRIAHQAFIAPMGNFRFSTCKPDGDFARQPLHRQIQLLFELAVGTKLTPTPELPIPAPYGQLARELLPPGPCYVGLAPGAGGKDKCWPLAHFIAVAQAQLANERLPVFFLGPAERDWLQPLRSAVPRALFPESDPRADLRGPLLAIALAARLHLGLANDSGVGHLLAAGGKPLVALFGRTNPTKFAPPYGERAVIRAHDFGAQGVAEIPVAHVLRVMEDVLGAR